MKQRTLGSLTVSVVGLGCNNFGIRLDQERATEAWSTRPSTPGSTSSTPPTSTAATQPRCSSAALGARRDEVVIATKFGMPIDDTHFGATPAVRPRGL